VNYFIQRDGRQYGPYTVADLQRHVASGEMLDTDLAFSESSSDTVPVSQIIGTIPIPESATHIAAVVKVPRFHKPPNLYWGFVLLFNVLTGGMFAIIWDIVQAAWLRKLEPTCKSLYYYILADACAIGSLDIVFSAYDHTNPGRVAYQLIVACGVLVLIGRFSFRASIVRHFNGPDPMGLSLSGVMTFFFGGIYFQYHINDIIRRRKQQDIFYQRALLQFMLFLFAFAIGSFLPLLSAFIPSFLRVPSVISRWNDGTRGFQWDGVFLMLALFVPILLFEALRKRIRSAAPWTALALALAALAGLALKFGFMSFDR
jgi:hypothetical protein